MELEEKLKATLRKMGHSQGVLIPKAILAQLGISDQLDMTVEDNAIVLRKPMQPEIKDAAVAAIEYSLATDEGIEFLRCWLHGNFEAIRREWPDAPEAVFVGADPLHKSALAGKVASHDEKSPLSTHRKVTP